MDTQPLVPSGDVVLEVLDANELFYRAFNHQDLPLMDNSWSRFTPVTCIHPGQKILEGRDLVMASWAGVFSRKNPITVTLRDSNVTFAGDTALVCSQELMAGAPFLSTNLFVREEAHWKLIHHHSGPVY